MSNNIIPLSQASTETHAFQNSLQFQGLTKSCAIDKDAYNQLLSQKRANSTMNWLIKKGISAERLSARGFGESKLINECADDIKCSEEAHQLNKQTRLTVSNEILIVGLKAQVQSKRLVRYLHKQ